MSNYDISFDEARCRTIANLQVASDEIYVDIIPEEMNSKRLNKIFYEVFGAEIIDIYLSRNVFELKSILITDFAPNGFFWAQMEEEAQSDEFRELFDSLNSEKNTKRPLADLKSKWCIAKFQGEWFRAYIDKILEDKKLRVFFLDYGTTEIIDHEDTRQADDDDIWTIGPLAIPFVVKDMVLSKIAKFKKLQYSVLNVSSLKIIEKTCIFEVELEDVNGTPLLKFL